MLWAIGNLSIGFEEFLQVFGGPITQQSLPKDQLISDITLKLNKVMHQSFPAVPIPPSPANPRALGFFENKPANALRQRKTSCSNAPQYR